ncbi:MAG: hypothetical protein FD143_3776 [Ignavibacteria bacterium]|nr:MAG: hypothetical protein FD143_3776 [Ignavibacteria bacterium]
MYDLGLPGAISYVLPPTVIEDEPIGITQDEPIGITLTAGAPTNCTCEVQARERQDAQLARPTPPRSPGAEGQLFFPAVENFYEEIQDNLSNSDFQVHSEYYLSHPDSIPITAAQETSSQVTHSQSSNLPNISSRDSTYTLDSVPDIHDIPVIITIPSSASIDHSYYNFHHRDDNIV